MGCSKHACNPVQRRTEIVSVSRFCRTGMDGHANSNRLVDTVPRFPGNLMLCTRSGEERINGCRKYCAKGIADSLEYGSIVGLDRTPHDGVMPGERFGHQLGKVLPQCCAAFYIG